MRRIPGLIIAMGLMLSSCDHKQPHSGASNVKESRDCLPDSLSALDKGRRLLIEKYGYVDPADHTYEAVLSRDSVWHIVAQPIVFENEQMKDTMHINLGSDVVLINKHNCDVIGFHIAR